MQPASSSPRFAAVTIASKAYLSLARVTARSFKAHHPEIPFYLLLTDRCDGFFDPDDEPFEVIQIEDLAIPRLERLAYHYQQQAFSYAVTPHVMRHLLQQGFGGVLFLKQETLILGRLSPLFERAPQASMILTPHLLEPPRCNDPVRMELDVLRSGVYNGGVVFASQTEESLRFLSWWASHMETACEVRLKEGLHYEQRWLDHAPGLVQGCTILRHPGVNVGHWNLSERTIRVDGSSVFANDEPCLIFRFSGYDPDLPNRVTKYPPLRTLDSYPGAAEIFRRYHQMLLDEGYMETRHWPYAYGISNKKREGNQ